MPPFGPVRRRDLVRYLRKLGFAGPFVGGSHEFMIRGTLTLTLPNPHRREIGRDLLARILRQASIQREEWEAL
jgi:predicted RNA binding protein YcfA (HicA-like mRNA interferase family)